jgi:hypothetical protein
MPSINDVTRLFSALACIVGLLALAMLGCSDLGNDAGAGGAAGDGSVGTGGASGAGGDPEITATLLINTFEVPAEGEFRPLEGVRICQLDTDNCVTSSEAGRAALDLPANQEVAYTAEKEGFGSFLTAFVFDDNFRGVTSEPMHTDEQLAVIAAELEVQYPWTSGILGANTLPQLPGATFELLNATGKSFYGDMRGYSLEPDSTSGVTVWPAPLGSGGFAELAEDEYQVEFGGAAAGCSVISFGWPGDAPNRVRIPVRVGYIAYGSLRCD